MKNVILWLFVVSLSSFTAVAPSGNFDFVGKWTGKDDAGVTGGFIFDKEGYITMTKGDDTMGGKDFVIEGNRGSMKYTIDQSAKPIKLDIIMEANGRTKKALLIIKIVDKNTIVVAGDMNSIRPKAITKDNSITLTRQ